MNETDSFRRDLEDCMTAIAESLCDQTCTVVETRHKLFTFPG
jgi:hypothetical protein